MTLLLNILWFILGGFLSGLGWLLATVLMAISIIGIPFVRSCFTLAMFSFWPFGRDVVSRKDLTGQDDLGTGTLGLIGNIVWFVLCGWWLAVWHITAAVMLGITIIGIPFAVQHLKLAVASLLPVGKTVVDYDTIERARAGRNPTASAPAPQAPLPPARSGSV
ncbi:YccF domain-containing protein [Taklimakanibacter deserti]|uniref:YccF domain-containing protein n=1 Tax=Taklimakanibacter deserti TaxID=2267839 RepID=UPI000E6580E1